MKGDTIMGRKNHNARKINRARRSNQLLINESLRESLMQTESQKNMNPVAGEQLSLPLDGQAMDCVSAGITGQKIQLIPIKCIVTEGYQRIVNSGTSTRS